MPQFSYRFEAIGTFFEIVTEQELTKALTDEVIGSIEAFDAYFSRFRRDSVVTQMMKTPGKYTLPAGSDQLLALYEELYELTEMKVNPLVGASLESLGYDAHYRLTKQASTPAPPLSLLRRNGQQVELAEPIVLDVGAAGKGYLVDSIGRILEENQITSYVIDASGDMLVNGGAGEQVGLEDPLHEGRVIGQINVRDQALCASAVNRRKWGDGLHHVVDPTSGDPTQDIIATWVLAETTLLADGLATALFFTHPNTLATRYTYEYMRVHADGTIEFSKAFSTALY